jgi:hypothetical protein
VKQLPQILQAFAASPDVLLMGALPFAAHKLATGAGKDEAGVGTLEAQTPGIADAEPKLPAAC